MLRRLEAASLAVRRRRRLFLSIAFLGTLALSWQPILLGLSAFMTVRSPLESADFIMPLYHDGESIPSAVADLHRRGLAPRVLLHRRELDRLEQLGLVRPRHETWRRLLEARGVPPADILTLDSTVKGEHDLPRAIADSIPDRKRFRVIAVASAPHSRLSRNALRSGSSVAVDFRMYPVTPRYLDERGWWRSKVGWITYFDAYCFWLLRWVR